MLSDKLNSVLDAFKTKYPALIGVDISSTAIKLVELVEAGKGAYRLERYAIEPLVRDVVTDGNIANLDLVADALKRAHKRLGSRYRNVALALPAAMVITKKIIVPSGQREEELELMVEAEANQYIPFALDEVNLDFQTIGPAPNNPDESEVLIAASRKEKVEDRVAVAEAAGLKPRVMDVESYAMQQAFELISPSLPASGRDQNIALVDIGAHVTHFYVLRNNQFLFSRDQAFGGNQLTHDVQRAFNLTPDEAESAKKSQGSRRTTTPTCCNRSWKRWRSRSPARSSSSSRRRPTTRSTRSSWPAVARSCRASTSWSPSGPASRRSSPTRSPTWRRPIASGPVSSRRMRRC